MKFMQGNIFNDILVFTALFFLSRLLIDTLLKQDDVVILEKFVKAYQEVCNTSRLLIQVIVIIFYKYIAVQNVNKEIVSLISNFSINHRFEFSHAILKSEYV